MYRKQTLYLLAVTVLLGLLLLFPLANIETLITDMPQATNSTEQTAEYNVWGVIFSDGDTDPFIYHGILALLATLLPIATIYLHKRRELQLRLCVVEGIFILALIGFEAYGLYQITSALDGTSALVNYSVVLVSPLIALLALVMAYRGVAADIWLLRDSDRIR